jgi:predicted Zn finger-like uncharacterized protein
MQFACTNCHAKIKVPDNAAGKKGKCPKCGTDFTVPSASNPAPPTMAAPPGLSPLTIDAPPSSPPTNLASAPPSYAGYSVPPRAEDLPRYDDDEAESPHHRDDIPLQPEPLHRRPLWYSVVSLVLGSLSLLAGGFFSAVILFGTAFAAILLACCFCPAGGMFTVVGFIGLALAALLALGGGTFGALGLRLGRGKAMSIIGLSTSGITILLTLVTVVLALIFGVALMALPDVAPPPQPQPFPRKF